MKKRVQFLRAHDVRFVQVVWCDNANVIRAKAPSVDTVERTGGTVGISTAQQAVPVMVDTVVPDAGLGPVGEVLLEPDWSTLRLLPYLPGFAQVMGDMRMGGRAWEHCPRSFLREQIGRLAGHGLELQASFENEFFLLLSREDGAAPVPGDDTVFAAAHAFTVGGDVILDMVEALGEQGLEVETYYPSSGPGQHELPIRYRDAMAAADAQITYRETVRGVAFNHGMVASFLPKIVEDEAGSGCHLNMSLWQGEENVTGDASRGSGLSRQAGAFVAGILEHMPALCALTLPSHASYRRIRPHALAGAFTAWGYDNREATVRAFGAGDRASMRFELKCVDATANPYLALGATLAAGIDGLERDLGLPPEVRTDPGLLHEADRDALKVKPLPADLYGAMQELERDETLLAALGDARARAFLAVRRAEWEGLKDLEFEDEVALLLQRY